MISNSLQLMYKRTDLQSIRKICIAYVYCTFILKKTNGIEPIWN